MKCVTLEVMVRLLGRPTGAMRVVLTVVTIGLLVSSCAHRRSWESESPPPLRLAPEQPPVKPLLVMMELDPWQRVIGSDSAQFVLYEDGLVIYVERDGSNRATRYVTAKLTPEGRDGFLAHVAPSRLNGLRERYVTAPVHDLNTTVIVSFQDGQPRRVSVYGPLDRAEFEELFGYPWDNPPPPEFVKIYRCIRAFRAHGAKPWRPEVVEVMLGFFDHARSTRPWPTGWPDLDDAAALPTRDTFSPHYEPGRAGMIFVDGRDLDPLLEYLREGSPADAVLMNGQKLSVNLRYVIPGEHLWNRLVPASH